MQVHPALKCFSGSKLRSSRLPVAGKKDAQCSNDLISLPMDKANRNRRSIRSPKPAPPKFRSSMIKLLFITLWDLLITEE